MSKDGSYNTEEPGEELDLFGKYSPSWGEINYRAYGIPSVEFHNELYGFIQARAIEENNENSKEEVFDKFLSEKCKELQIDKPYTRLKKDGSTLDYDVTISTYIRNLIHHPENANNSDYTDAELIKSIDCLIEVIEDFSKE